MHELALIEKLVTPEKVELIARAILLAQDIKEESFDMKRIDDAKAKGENVNPFQCYKKNDAQSANEAVFKVGFKDDEAEFWSMIISNLNYNNWNEAQGWAEDIIA